MKNAMQTSAAAIQSIRAFEGLSLRGYLDTGGIPTIGYGTTGPHIYVGQSITPEQAEDWMLEHLRQVETGICDHLAQQLTQGQFDALVDFAYNMGLGRLLGSTLFRCVGRGDNAGAAGQFGFWVHGRDGNGVETVLPGLARRRDVEAMAYRTGAWPPM